MVFFMSGRLNEKKFIDELEAVPEAFVDDAETGDFPVFPSEIETAARANELEEDIEKPVVLPMTIEGGLTLKNNTSYEPDLTGLLAEELELNLPDEGVQVLIIHTHGSESYTPDRMNEYIPTDNYRTEDKNFNMIRVGDELKACLESYGITVLHDREIYDYPSYIDSYIKAAEAIKKHLTEHPEITIVLDLHRDAIGNGEVVYKTVAEGSGEPSSQLMLLVGSGENLEHPAWTKNLRFALFLQSAAIEKYPTLMRPIALFKERFNQHLTEGSLILEVGSSGNTLAEALRAVRLFADAAAPALLDLRLNDN